MRDWICGWLSNPESVQSICLMVLFCMKDFNMFLLSLHVSLSLFYGYVRIHATC